MTGDVGRDAAAAAAGASSGATPSAVPLPNGVRLLLYGRGYCHLCDDMASALRVLGHAFSEVDVDADPDLEDRMGEKVPVLMIEGAGRAVEVCHYFLDAERLEACVREFLGAIR